MYSVMIVDDEKAIRDNMASLVPFQEEGFVLCGTAVNGEDALQKLEQLQPDLILLDVSMPVLDGIGFLKKMREGKYKEVQVVILSGYSEFEYAKQAMRYGAKAYLTKPVDEDEAVEILREVRTELEAKEKQHYKRMLQKGIMTVRHLYRGKAEDMSGLESYFLFHCVLLSDVQKTEGAGINILWNVMGEELEDAEAGFFRVKGSVYSYLFPIDLLQKYQGKTYIFARHIIHRLKVRNIVSAALVDETVFGQRKDAFRKVFDERLYRMMAEIFYGTGDCVIYGETRETEGEETALETEELFLKGMERALAELQWSEAEKWLESLFGEIEEKKPGLIYLQEIHYRIHYLLLKLMKECGPLDVEKKEEQVLCVMDWREQSQFIRFGKWKELHIRQIRSVYEWLGVNRRNYGMGVVGEVIDYVQTHYREQLSLRQVAELFYVNAAYLGRVFQRMTGVGFKKYVNDLRMEEAKRILLQTDCLVYEVAQQVGFVESKYFIQKFTEETGESPSEYRKNAGEGQN